MCTQIHDPDQVKQLSSAMRLEIEAAVFGLSEILNQLDRLEQHLAAVYVQSSIDALTGTLQQLNHDND